MSIDYKDKIKSCNNSINAEEINIKVENDRINRLEDNLKYYDKDIDKKIISKVNTQIMNSQAEIRRSESSIERLKNTIKHYEIMLDNGGYN